MDIQDKYDSFRTNFYMYKGKREMIYFVCMLMYCVLCFGSIFYIQYKMPELYAMTITKVIFVIMVVSGISVHFLMKALFHRVFTYKSYFVKSLASFSAEELAEVREYVENDSKEYPRPESEPFIRTAKLFLDKEVRQ